MGFCVCVGGGAVNRVLLFATYRPCFLVLSDAGQSAWMGKCPSNIEIPYAMFGYLGWVLVVDVTRRGRVGRSYSMGAFPLMEELAKSLIYTNVRFFAG